MQKRCLIPIEYIVAGDIAKILWIEGSSCHELDWVTDWIFLGSTLQKFLYSHFDNMRDLLAFYRKSDGILFLLAVKMNPFRSMLLAFQYS